MDVDRARQMAGRVSFGITSVDEDRAGRFELFDQLSSVTRTYR